jgi:hypothetical protein
MKRLLICLVFGTACLTGCLFPRSSPNAAEDKSDSINMQKSSLDNDSVNRLSSENGIQNNTSGKSDEKWSSQLIENGELPECYSFKPFIGDIDNYLEVSVGSSTDVCIKVMNQRTEKCNRFVFVKGGSTFRISNIPEGKYYLKIAYGKAWQYKVENGKCIGRFSQNVLYKKGEDLLDFYIKEKDKGYNVPSFRLELDIIQNDTKNSFNSESISESEFNL